MSLVTSLQPDIVLLDLAFGSETSIDKIPLLMEAAPSARILVLTGVSDQELHKRALLKGAHGLLMKDKAGAVLRTAIKKEWGELTPEQHKQSLIRDFKEPDHASRRNEACLRLGYYYPESLEPLVLKQLADPLPPTRGGGELPLKRVALAADH